MNVFCYGVLAVPRVSFYIVSDRANSTPSQLRRPTLQKRFSPISRLAQSEVICDGALGRQGLTRKQSGCDQQWERFFTTGAAARPCA